MNCRTFVNGKIFTGENETAFTDSITVEDGKIVAIGEKGRGEIIDEVKLLIFKDKPSCQV
ncbi:hypothetical protein PF586_09640 [Lactobacillus delbrueckii]|uniref:Uncharacterized protein n=1 Tax=Lactobacillus delbrueckii TaxID=1584 RepID=A0AAW5YX02_9LACO|nr:hypothetical protein [Lactobacillus delbrueckii]MDA3768663.1 hypothetical protein [Lactobacillus delbrueckii]MDF4030155.1 hypothetical protein [Lactobacillus delbrueckii]